ncbi:Translation initiation factor IF-3, mitochondrial [Frankliniella fusca]|uniref:Translation initiation factor IF-3, mitochondrial n=1 Tax=Frankliniella fusca TaxID=407009 RepID=A0AAE1HTH3_9NEOP|nr:Translation initiation factor IF-3, mitochondrial [Frankliniella fusca]
MLTVVNRCANRILALRSAQRSVALLSSETENAATKKKKKPPEVRINLIENTTLTVISLDGAKKLAAKKGCQLTPVDSPAHWMLSGDRTPYEFLAPSQKASKKVDDVKAQGFKGLKTSIFSSSIQERDIAVKIKQLTKWIKSGYVVEVAIDVSENSNAIRAAVEEAIGDTAKLPGTIKRDSKTLLKLRYEPLIKPNKKEDELETAGS